MNLLLIKWDNKTIRTLEDSIKTDGNLEDLIYFVKKVDKKAKVINLSIKYQILSEYTSFVGIEKELVD